MYGLVSIIIPVYNTEKYLVKCLESCFGQTYSRIEIIGVDDGSTDNSGRILDALKLKDSRLKVIHKRNEGVVRARFVGIEESYGNYLYFLDSDDWLNDFAIESLHNCIVAESSDIVISGCHSVKHNDIVSEEKYEPQNLTQEQFCSLFLTKKIQGGVWGKLFRREICILPEEEVNFQVRNNEDYLFLMQILNKASVISVIDQVGYNYLLRENSASKTIRSSVSKDILGVTNSILFILYRQKFYSDILEEISIFCSSQLSDAIIHDPYCYKDPVFAYIYKKGESAIKHLQKRSSRIIMYSYQFGGPAFVVTANCLLFPMKVKKIIKSCLIKIKIYKYE